MAQAVLEAADLATIRSVSLSNLERWKANGTWGLVYEQWWKIMTEAPDHELVHIMTGQGDEPNRLRQSSPYVGIIDEETRLKVYARYHEARAANYVPDPQTWGQKVKSRRRALGLTQQRLANLAEVSRRKVRRIEASTVRDFDAQLSDKILHILGLNVDKLALVAPPPKNGLRMAARFCSINYTNKIDENQLRNALARGKVYGRIESSLHSFLDEVPVHLVVLAIEETASLESVHPARIWINLDKLAGQLHRNRASLWAY